MKGFRVERFRVWGLGLELGFNLSFQKLVAPLSEALKQGTDGPVHLMCENMLCFCILNCGYYGSDNATGKAR